MSDKLFSKEHGKECKRNTSYLRGGGQDVNLPSKLWKS